MIIHLSFNQTIIFISLSLSLSISFLPLFDSSTDSSQLNNLKQKKQKNQLYFFSLVLSPFTTMTLYLRTLFDRMILDQVMHNFLNISQFQTPQKHQSFQMSLYLSSIMLKEMHANKLRDSPEQNSLHRNSHLSICRKVA